MGKMKNELPDCVKVLSYTLLMTLDNYYAYDPDDHCRLRVELAMSGMWEGWARFVDFGGVIEIRTFGSDNPTDAAKTLDRLILNFKGQNGKNA